MPTFNRFSTSMSPVAILVAILALVVAAGGVGYAAGQVGTSDLKDNAVTSPKVKNGTLKAADLVKEKKFTKVSAAGAPNFSNGGEGDCVWASGASELPGVGAPSVRVDRFGTVQLAGVAVGRDGVGGDATCDPSTEVADGVVMTLPRKLQPATTQIRPVGTGGSIIIVGPDGLDAGPSLTLLPGTVYWQGTPSFGVLLDGISYLPAGSKLAAHRPTGGKVTAQGRVVLRNLAAR